MALSAKVVTYTANTGTGDQTLASAGFTPKAAIVYFSRATTAVDTFTENASFGVGITDGTNSRCMYTGSEDNQTSSDTVRLMRDDCLIVTTNLTGTLTTQDGKATFSSFNSDGMVINWSDAPAAGFKFHVFYLGGTDLTNVNVGTLNIASGSGTQDITTVGFQPDCVLNFGWVGSSLNAATTPTEIIFGAADSTGNQWVQSICVENGRTTTDNWQVYSHSKFGIIQIATTGSVASTFSLSSMLSNGFQINRDDTNGSGNNFFFLALKGGSYVVGNDTEPDSTGDQTITTNKDTKGVMLFGLDTGTAGSAQVDTMMTMGAGTSSTNMATVVLHDTDNTGDSVCVSRYETDSIYLNITANATASSSTVDDEASLSSVSSTGFVINWSNVGQARPFRYIAFGNAPSSTLYTRTIDESSISVSETISRVLTGMRSSSESSISVSETVARMGTYYRIQSESSIAVSETVARMLTAMRALDESGISVSDDLQRLRTAFASISEPSISVSETLDRILYAFRTITESTIDVSETVSGNLFFLRDISETAISVSETLARTLYTNRTIDENVAVSETVDRILTAFRAIGEAGVSVSETLNALFIQVRSIDESVNVSDSLERMATFFRTLTESSIVVSEQLDRILTANRIVTESSITVSETVDRQLLAFRTLAESSITVSETLDRVLTAFRTISEPSVSVSESLDRILTAMRTLSESSISVSDLLERTFYANRESIETVNVSEQLERILTAYRTIDESSISVSEILNVFVPIVRTINEPSISVSDSIARLLSAFRVIGESVNVSDQLTIVGPDYEIARFITDKGYMNPLRVRIRFVDRHDENHIYYTYDAFNPDQRPFNILAANIRLAQGEIGVFTIDIEDSAKTVIKDNIGFGTKVQIDVKKEYGTDWNRVMTGFVRRLRKIRAATNTLQWQVQGVGTQVVFNERVTNYKRAAKRSSVDSIDPLPTDSRMFASNLFKDLISATDILPLRRPSLMETGGFTLDEISPDVVDFIAQVSPGLTDAASVANAFSELTGAIWGCNSEGNPFFRYPTQKHSGIIIKDDPQDTDSALITSTNVDAFDYEDTIDLAEGFANRLYVLNAVDTKSTASSSGASGSTTLTFRGIAQQFTATDNNITGAAFILSKVGNPSNKDNCVFGYLRGDNNGYPNGPTLASFQITFDQIETAKSTVFVNDIKPKEGTIIPGNKYWWFLFSALTSESNTIRWHHDNDQLTINRFSAILPFIDQDPTKPGNQLNWNRSDKGPVYAFSTFSSIRHILEHSDPESIKEYGLVEGIVDLPAFEDDPTFQKALVQILKTSSKPKRIYNYNRVTIPTQRLFFPGELVTVIDSKADLTSEKNVIAEIAQVQYTFDTSRNAMGCKYVDVLLMGFVDKVLDDYLDSNQC